METSAKSGFNSQELFINAANILKRENEKIFNYRKNSNNNEQKILNNIKLRRKKKNEEEEEEDDDEEK